ncbi:aminotransferase class I/II-fold pyridoxal phosphate-dependent enzyme [Promicromonospora thailandica]|uniref:Aminotransferase n=1 Tax=Promicromonospora thailandica TaxID=765201 RepID=A0A9X2JVZ0_9MICO|nr:aminotransferase class I/II-fold pyridoxal phosphate-dependent enzyme [Promicromonospora thailandica]MCP2265591.1 aspartate aminotransferase [Promicromonospora thailandica]BFF17152.1 pyridoxal phosphate-dependent aminotransferase [Promicromonospora thailandica]
MSLSRRAQAAQEAIEPVTSFFLSLRALDGQPDVVDLTFGDPHEMPLPALVDALRTNVEPRSADWFAYKSSLAPAQEAVAAGLRAELGLPFAPEDVAMTQGAFGAIAVALRLVADAGDEVVVPEPGWFYAPMLRAADLVPVRASLTEDTFDLDVEAVARAITPRTRVVVVNSPANPTGRVYGRDRLTELGEVLEAASARSGRRIWLLSDEPYRRIRFDGIGFTSPAECYPWTLVDYSYGKVLLAPGQRLGYLALSPRVPDTERAELRAALLPLQMGLGWGFPDAVMQYSAPALETVSIDVAELARRRDLMVGALGAAGYDLTVPEGTFYLWGAAPGGDAAAFTGALARRGVHVLPGTVFARPGHFRISLTATGDMLERALPALRELAP